jgi:DNA-binding LacI/PurR family transcriptional regulator
MKYITIKDVAKALNVSVSTVSRAFNDKYDIRKETRDFILTKSREMGYHPNPIAKKLRSQCSFNIGVVVPEFINPFFHEVIIGIQDVLFKAGYQVLIMQSNESTENELENIKTLENNMVDGIIISISQETSNIDYYRKLTKEGFPLVMFNRVADEINVPKVIFDDYKWAFFATEHLIYQGYKKIFHFSGPKVLGLCQKRAQGFQDALKKHRIPVSADLIIETGLQIADGERMIQKLIDEKNLPEAIFCVNDMTAIGTLKKLKQNGFKIPTDVALVGFTETKAAELIEPQLTTVAQPTFEMGQIAAKLLLEQINSKGNFVPQEIVLNGRLNIRDSSVKIM